MEAPCPRAGPERAGLCFSDLADRHLVGGEGACLVGTDDRGAAQSLDRGQAPHDSVFLGHPAGAQGQAGGDDCRQAWGGEVGVREQ